MIVRSGPGGFGGVTTLVVDPIVVTQPTGLETVGPSGELIVGDPQPKAFNWWWLLAAVAAGLAVGWWLTGDSARGPLAK